MKEVWYPDPKKAWNPEPPGSWSFDPPYDKNPETGEDMEKIPFEEYCRKIFDPKKIWDKPEALKGWRHLSQTMYILSPHVGATLAEYGAEVIKFEMPKLADPMRHTSPFNEAYLWPETDHRPMVGTGWGFLQANANKYFVTIDYHAPEAREIVEDLWRISDSLAECYRPGTFYRWGIGYPQVMEVNPRLIYIWLGGFGNYGPRRYGGSYDILGQACGGLAAITGFHEDFGGHPAKQTNWVIDWYSGLTGLVGVLAAAHYRKKTGLGTFVDLSQISCATRATGYAFPVYGRFGVVRQRWGNWDTLLCVHGIIYCGKSIDPEHDNPQVREEMRYVMVSAFQDEDFHELCRIIGRLDLWEKYKYFKDRVNPRAQIEIYAALEEWAADKNRNQVVEILNEAGLIAVPVMSAKDIYECEHFWVRGSIYWVDDPLYGEVLCHAATSKLSETPPRTKWVWRPLGADNIRIYHELLGYPLSKLKELYEKGII